VAYFEVDFETIVARKQKAIRGHRDLSQAASQAVATTSPNAHESGSEASSTNAAAPTTYFLPEPAGGGNEGVGFTSSVGGPLVATSEFAEGEEEDEDEDEDEDEEGGGGNIDEVKATEERSHISKEAEALPNVSGGVNGSAATGTVTTAGGSSNSNSSDSGISLSYALVAGDLRQLDHLEEALSAAGFDRSLPTLFLAE
jgi:hypothetical protein